MAEKRSIPAALGIFIGPAIAYLSFLILKLNLIEFVQLACFAAFLVVGADLARSRISLSGILTILFVPALPIALYLNQATSVAAHHLSPMMIIVLWVVSALTGAILAGLKPNNSTSPVFRMVAMASVLMVLLLASFWFLR